MIVGYWYTKVCRASQKFEILVAYRVQIEIIQLICLVVRDNAKAGNLAK